jgi:Arc/MetJ family transcription regulator
MKKWLVGRSDYAHIYGHMKTTIEIDEGKLDRIMKLTGIGTMKEAVDWALSEALRLATINRVMEEPWSAEEAREAVDPAYDLIAIRNGASPVSYLPEKASRRGRPRKAAK